MIEDPLKEDSLRVAISRIEDFAAVHRGKGDLVDAIMILRESLGITDAMSTEFTDWTKEFFDDGGYEWAMLLGVMMGVIAADHARV